MAFSVNTETVEDEVRMTLKGELDANVADQFKGTIELASKQNPKRLVLFMNDLVFMASAGLRVLIFAKQKMGTDVSIYLVGCTDPVLNTLKMSGFHQSVYLKDAY